MLCGYSYIFFHDLNIHDRGEFPSFQLEVTFNGKKNVLYSYLQPSVCNCFNKFQLIGQKKFYLYVYVVCLRPLSKLSKWK